MTSMDGGLQMKCKQYCTQDTDQVPELDATHAEAVGHQLVNGLSYQDTKHWYTLVQHTKSPDSGMPWIQSWCRIRGPPVSILTSLHAGFLLHVDFILLHVESSAKAGGCEG